MSEQSIPTPQPGHAQLFEPVRNLRHRGTVRFCTAPQIAGRDEPFRSAIREHLKGHTQGLEDLAVEMLARGL